MATEFVGIELELRGEEGVYNDLRKIQSIMNSLGGRKKIDAGLQDARRQVVAYRGELEKLQRTQDKISRGLKSGVLKGDFWEKQLANTEKAVTATRNALKDSQQAVRVFQQGIKESGKTFQQAATAITSRARQIGGSMQSLGNSMVRLTSPFTSLTTGLLYGAGYKALNMITSGFSGAFERYDTMQNYAKSLKALGLDADQTFKIFEKQDKPLTAIENLNEAVLGLPTGLDEIVAAQKVYAGATGEMVKSTKAAIAANNTFLASGMDARSQRFMQRYLVSLASGAELTTTQWQSMARIAPLAMRAVSEELGYASKDYQKFISDLHSGTVASEEFLEAFIKVGTDGRVQAAANVMKTTWAGLAANIQNATKRMGEGILKALDDAFVSYNGRNFVQNLLGFDAEGNEIGGGIKHWINGISDSVQGWIRANPDVIMDFFNDLKKIDVKGLITGVAKGFGDIAKAVKWFANTMSDKSLEGVGRWMVRLNLLGRSIGVLGGLIRGLAPVIGNVGALLTKVGKVGLFGKIAELFGGIGGKFFGAKGAKDIADGAGALGKASGGILALAKNIGLIAGSVAAVGGAGFVAFRSFKTIVKDLHEAIREINSFSTGELQQADAILFGMASALTGFVVAADAIGIAVGSLGSIGTFPAVIGGAVMAIVGAMAALVSAETMAIFKSFEQSTKSLKQGLKNIEELGNIKFNKDKVETALGTMKQIMETFDASYDEGGSAKEGGTTHADWSARSGKFKLITQNISEAIKSVKDTMNELNSLPDITEADVQSATDKVNNVVGAMRDIARELNFKFDTNLSDFFGGNTVITKGTTGRAGSIVENIKGIITTIKDTVAELKSLETLDVELDTAVGNVKDIGTKMGEIFTALNDAFGQEFITDSDGSFVQKTNEGVTKKQTKKAEALKTLFDSYKQSIEAIRGIYESLVGKEGDMSLDLGKFNEVMSNISGEDGIIAQLKGMYDGLISEESGFGQGGDVDLAGIMESFATAIGSVKQAVTTLAEIGQIEFEGDDGMSGIVTAINEMVTGLTTSFSEDAITPLTEQIALFKQSMEQIKLSLQDMATIGEEVDIASISSQISGMVTGVSNAFNAEAIAGLTAQVEAFRLQIETIKTTIQSLGGEEGAINLDIMIVPNITGDEETVSQLEDAHDAIETARDAIKELSESINLSFPISASLPGLEGAIASMYNAASRLRAARASLSAAGYATGGTIAPSGAKYYAKGGNISSGGFPGRPMGTDTVPIWATPGEWMMRKKAVDLFGTEFMRRVNNLDVRGAMNALMAKAGHMANVGRQTVINNTYNNNQKVVQNISTNSPDFAYRSASRFVGAF